MCKSCCCLNLKCLHSTTIMTFLLSRCSWIYLWSCREGLIVAALQGRLVVFMCVLRLSFSGIHKIALFAYFITQVYLPLLRWSWMVPEGTKKTFVLLFVLNVACRVKSLHCGPIWPIETSCVLFEPFIIYMLFRRACSWPLCPWRTDLPCKDSKSHFVFLGFRPLKLRDTVQICGVHQ